MPDEVVRASIAGVTCEWRPNDPTWVTYIPHTVAPERDPAGRPAVMLLKTGTRPILQLGTRWETPADVLFAVRAEIARRHPPLDPVLIHMQPVMVDELRAELLTRDRHGEWSVLTSTTTSGYPPYNAILRIDVPDDRLPEVTAALAGESGHVKVRYCDVTAQSSSPFQETAAVTEGSTLAEGDLGRWLSGGPAIDPIVVPTGGSEAPTDPEPLPGPDGETVPHRARLGFDPERAPIAYIDLGSTARLSGPEFAASLPEPMPEEIELRTHFTTAGEPHVSTVEVPAEGELVLSEGELGLATISIDGRAREEAGIRQIRVHASYRPGPNGERDDRTFSLGPDSWEWAWQVVTRAAEFDGVLVIDTMERDAQGEMSWTPARELTEPCVTL